MVDDLTGAKLGRAKSATFRTADVVGLDTMGHVIKTMQDNLQDDPFYPVYKTPEVLAKLIAAGALGQKTGAGFYKKVGKDILRFDAAKGDYVAGGGKADDLVARILKEKDPAKRMKALHDSTNPQAQFLWAIFRDAFHYIAVHLESIADNARDVDFAMRWGFGWSIGPFETWQAAGWQQVANGSRKTSTPARRCAMRRCRPGCSTARSRKAACIRRTVRGRRPRKPMCRARTWPVYQRQVFRAPLLGDSAANGNTAGTTVFEDESVRIWHQDDEVLILSLKTKMHVIGQGVINGLAQAIAEAEKNYKGLVIWHADAAEGGAFSAGADLQSMLPLFMSGGVKAIEPEVAQLAAGASWR